MESYSFTLPHMGARSIQYGGHTILPSQNESGTRGSRISLELAKSKCSCHLSSLKRLPQMLRTFPENKLICSSVTKGHFTHEPRAVTMTL